MQSLSAVWSLAVSLFRQEMKERFAGSLLGAMWMFIWPLVQLFIYIVIFGKLMGGRFSGDAQIYSYGVYVASGLIVWTCFSNVLIRTSRIFVEKRHIIGKVQVSLWVFPLAICFTELFPYAVSFFLLACVDAYSGWIPALPLCFYALLALYCQLLMAVGLGMLFATCAVFVRDAIEVLAVFVQVGFWFTPIVYLPSILPGWTQKLLSFNPMTHIVAAFQNLFVFQKNPELVSIIYIIGISHGLLLGAIWFVGKLEKDIRDLL